MSFLSLFLCSAFRLEVEDTATIVSAAVVVDLILLAAWVITNMPAGVL